MDIIKTIKDRIRKMRFKFSCSAGFEEIPSELQRNIQQESEEFQRNSVPPPALV
jgi:hypothetical protein